MCEDIGVGISNWLESRRHYQPNKPDRKKQGREAGEKKKRKDNWKPRNPLVSHPRTRRAGKPEQRTGLRMRGQRGHPEVRQALNRYARWLRRSHVFPIRVPVYLFPSPTIITQDGAHVSASFFGPFEMHVEPFIRIATGDYPELKRSRGRDDALAAYIISLSHEIAHYYQWLERRPMSERGAISRAKSMLRMYAADVERP